MCKIEGTSATKSRLETEKYLNIVVKDKERGEFHKNSI